MASISVGGLGSGMDIPSLVSQLVAAERATPDKRLTNTDAKLTAEFTALASLKSALASLQTSVNGLKGSNTFDLRKATVADEKYFTASVTTKAQAGNYDVTVQQLARSGQIGSMEIVGDASAVVGTGTLTIGVGSDSFTVEITEANNTLAGIRDAINAAAGARGVRATLVNSIAGDGTARTRLLLAGTQTGVSNDVSMSVADAGDGNDSDAAGLSQLVSGATVTAAQDAVAFVSGLEVRSATNTIKDAVDGVTLTLKQVTTGPVSLAVARDDAAILKKAEGFVAAFNSFAAQVKNLGSYNAATKTGGPLLGDSLLRGLDSQIRRMISEPVAGVEGSYTTLASLGITTTSSGTLQLDSAKFNAALQKDPLAAEKVFSSSTGVASKLSTYLDQKLSSAGEFATRDAGLTARRKDLDAQRDALDARMLVIQERYMKQFTALDTMLTQLQGTSSYLTTQLDSLSKLANRGD